MGFNRRFVSRVGSDEAIGPGIFDYSPVILIYFYSISPILGNRALLYGFDLCAHIPCAWSFNVTHTCTKCGC